MESQKSYSKSLRKLSHYAGTEEVPEGIESGDSKIAIFPFPTIVRDFQAVISKEIKEQMLEKENRLPDVVIACVGGGSNAIGSFYHFIEDKDVQLIGCEAAGRGIDTFETAATVNTGRVGIFHGMKSYFCQDKYGQIAPVYSISAGLDYPGIGPEQAKKMSQIADGVIVGSAIIKIIEKYGTESPAYVGEYVQEMKQAEQ